MRVLSSRSHRCPTIGEDGADMKTMWKVLLGLVLVVPMGAYVVGSLAASAADDPAPRQTIEIREPDPTSTPTPAPTRTSAPTPAPTSTSTSKPERTDDVEVITPDYDDFDAKDDSGDDDGGRSDKHGDDHRDDRHDSGHGGGHD
jgi:hypothetical protein